MAGKMWLATKGCTAKSVTYNAAAATYGVCGATSLALFIGANIPNRMAIGNTVGNAIAKALESFLRAKKPAAPAGGSVKAISINIPTLGVSRPAVADKTGATAVDDNTIAVLIGATLYGSADDSAVLLRALEAIFDAPTMQSFKKKG
jgi:fructose-specific phosphotransferase system IIC component